MRESLRLSIDALEFSYGSGQSVFECFDAGSLPIGRTALMGPSGVGKSTLLKLMTGIIHPSSGNISLTAAGGVKLDPSCIRTAYVSQEDSLLPWLSVAGSIALTRSLVSKGQANAASDAEIVSVVSDLGLADRLHALPYELSGGMRRRAALAASLLAGADFLVLDEPFAGSDLVKRSSMYKAIKAATEEGLADLMFTTHDAIDAIELATQVIWIGGCSIDKLAILDASEGWNDDLRSRLSALILGGSAHG